MAVDTYTKFLAEPEPKDREQSLEAYFKARLQSLDRAIAGYIAIQLQDLSGVVDLTPTQAKHRHIVVYGVPAGPVTLRIPHAAGANTDILFVNTCTGAFSLVTVKSTGANSVNPAGVQLAPGETRYVRQDGDGVYPGRTTVAVRLTNSTAIAFGSGVASAVTYDQERRDDGGLHSTSANTDAIVVPREGWGLVAFNVEISSNPTGFRTASIRRNGNGPTDIIWAAQVAAVSGTDTIIQLACLYYFYTGDVLRSYVYQNSGGPLSVQKSGQYSPEFAFYLL